MSGTNSESKNYRILSIHDRLNRGEVINKKECGKTFMRLMNEQFNEISQI